MNFQAFARDGLILSSVVNSIEPQSRALRRAVDVGSLVKLRRGAYVERSVWEQLDARSKHVLRIRSVIEMAHRDAIVAGFSAAALWGMPIAGEWPVEVTILDEWLGGGRSEPGVRRTAAGFRDAGCLDLGGVKVTTLARTALDIARGRSLDDAIGSVDWARWRRNEHAVSLEELTAEVFKVPPRNGRAHLSRVVNFSTSLSDSFGESECRAVIAQLGFEVPLLQVPFRDAEGQMEPDFYWPGVRIAGEFDGFVKYSRTEYTKGDPSAVVWREKKREDRLRRCGVGVVRILTTDVKNPSRLERLLVEAGVPRSGGR